MLDFSTYLERSNASRNSEEAFDVFKDAMMLLGYDQVLYSLMTDHPEIGKKSGHGILRNYPEDWMEYYTQKKYEDLDPVRRQVMISRGAFTWSDMEKKIDLHRNEKKVMNEAREAHLKKGVGLSIHGPYGQTVGMGFASSSGYVETNPNTLSLINALANQFHIVYCEHERVADIPRKTVHLTLREKEVLRWLSKGKTAWEIAEILTVTDETIKEHLKRIYSKLEVNSKILAVTKSLHLGHISLDY